MTAAGAGIGRRPLSELRPPFELLSATDARLGATTDPARSRRRIDEVDCHGEDQAGFRQRILAELDRNGAALADRSTAPGHLTGSAVVVDAQHERVLVMLHTKLRRWLQPGGHADGDHELAAVALREASEETGIDGLAVLVPAIDLDIHEVDHAGVDGDGTQRFLHLDVRFIVLAPPGAVRHANHESLDTAWVSLEELADLTQEASVTRVIRRALAELSGRPVHSVAAQTPDTSPAEAAAPGMAELDGMTVRPWQPGDLGFLWQMLYEALHVSSDVAALPRTVLAEPGVAHYLTAFGTLAGDDALVALDPAGELIGATWCRRFPSEDPAYGYVDDDTAELGMAVVSSWRRRGVGAALLGALQSRHQRLSLSVDPDNTAAVRLYRRRGFVTVTETRDTGSDGFDATDAGGGQGDPGGAERHPVMLWQR